MFTNFIFFFFFFFIFIPHSGLYLYLLVVETFSRIDIMNKFVVYAGIGYGECLLFHRQRHPNYYRIPSECVVVCFVKTKHHYGIIYYHRAESLSNLPKIYEIPQIFSLPLRLLLVVAAFPRDDERK